MAGISERFLLVFLAPLAAWIASGCGTVTLVRDSRLQHYDRPSLERQQAFFVFSLVGGTRVFDVTDVCLSRPVDQVATTYTGNDVLAAVITLGLFTPRTVQVWCGL